MKQKTISLVLIATLLLGLLSGCGAVSTSTAAVSDVSIAEDASPEESNATVVPVELSTQEDAFDSSEISAVEEAPALELQSVELPLFEETRSYTMWTMLPFFMNGLVSDMSTDINSLKLLQEYCNIKLDITSVADSAVSEQFNLMVSGGDYPDIISDGVNNYTKGYDAAITDDIIIDLYDLAVEYAPNYMYYLETDPALKAEMITDNGCLPSLATIYKEAGCENGGILIRSDWLEELGMDEPKTFEEFHSFVQACISKYGAQGICVGNAMSSNKGDDPLYSYGYDLYAGDYNVIDGQVVYSYLNDNYYDYLKMMSEWVADGTIYSDFINAKMGNTDMWFATGQCPVDTGSAANIATIEAYRDPDYNYEMMPISAPKVHADDSLHFSWTDRFSRIKQHDAWAISTACEDPEGIMQVVNFLFSAEGELMFNYGDEGHSFEYDENGNPQYTDLITNNPDGISYKDACFLFASAVASGFLPSIMDVRAGYYYFSDEEWAIFDAFRSCDADGSYNMPHGVALNEEESEEYAAVSSDVTTYATTEVMKFITGQTELTEENFQTFQDTIVEIGGNRMEELYQSAYERYLNKIA